MRAYSDAERLGLEQAGNQDYKHSWYRVDTRLEPVGRVTVAKALG